MGCNGLLRVLPTHLPGRKEPVMYSGFQADLPLIFKAEKGRAPSFCVIHQFQLCLLSCLLYMYEISLAIFHHYQYTSAGVGKRRLLIHMMRGRTPALLSGARRAPRISRTVRRSRHAGLRKIPRRRLTSRAPQVFCAPSGVKCRMPAKTLHV